MLMQTWVNAHAHFSAWAVISLLVVAVMFYRARNSLRGVNWIRLYLYLGALAGIAFTTRADMPSGMRFVFGALTAIILLVILFGKLLGG